MVVNIPIVTLDKVFVKPDEENIFFFDCTRINGNSELVSRKGDKLDKQLERLASNLSGKKVILSDDVVFSGSVLRYIIGKLMEKNIEVVGITCSICLEEAYRYFNNNLQYGIRTNYIMLEDVIDQICERDFYFGIAGSGIMVNTNDGLFKAPYFKPFGNPNERASIPKDCENVFSRGCIERSIALWEEINKLNERSTLIGELPERIIFTDENEGIVKMLKKELKRI